MKPACLKRLLTALLLAGALGGCAGVSPASAQAEGVSGWSEEGRASWYGRRFHGKKTASGEVYDMHALTAAHPTLPFGTRVRVTALDSGESVVVRVNDRGPFHSTRIIDVSYAAAHQLGITLKGTLAVRVQTVTGDAAAPELLPSGDYLQVGAFSRADNAGQLRARIVRRLDLAATDVSVRASEGLHRVWIGPFDTDTAREQVVERLRERMGLTAVRAHSDSLTEETP